MMEHAMRWHSTMMHLTTCEYQLNNAHYVIAFIQPITCDSLGVNKGDGHKQTHRFIESIIGRVNVRWGERGLWNKSIVPNANNWKAIAATDCVAHPSRVSAHSMHLNSRELRMIIIQLLFIITIGHKLVYINNFIGTMVLLFVGWLANFTIVSHSEVTIFIVMLRWHFYRIYDILSSYHPFIHSFCTLFHEFAHSLNYYYYYSFGRFKFGI